MCRDDPAIRSGFTSPFTVPAAAAAAAVGGDGCDDEGAAESLLAVDACVDACAASADNRDVAAAVYAGDIRIAGDPVDSTV